MDFAHGGPRVPTVTHLRIYTAVKLQCELNTLESDRQKQNRLAARYVPTAFSPIVVSHFFHSRREKFEASFKNVPSFRLFFLLLNFKQRQFGSVYRLSYEGSIYILRHLTVRQLSLGYILPLPRAFIPNSQRRWFLGKRQLQEHKATSLFKNIFNRNRVLSITHSPSGATTQIHTAIGSAVT